MDRVGVLACVVGAALAVAACRSQGAGGTAASLSAYASPAPAEMLTGGLADAAVGQNLGAKDRRAALAAEYHALEYGRSGAAVSWRGRSARGEVVPGPLYRVNDYNCREYTQTVTFKGQSSTASGTACRRPDGTWHAVG